MTTQTNKAGKKVSRYFVASHFIAANMLRFGFVRAKPFIRRKEIAADERLRPYTFAAVTAVFGSAAGFFSGLLSVLGFSVSVEVFTSGEDSFSFLAACL